MEPPTPTTCSRVCQEDRLGGLHREGRQELVWSEARGGLGAAWSQEEHLKGEESGTPLPSCLLQRWGSVRRLT